jgi:hypothetical protein
MHQDTFKQVFALLFASMLAHRFSNLVSVPTDFELGFDEGCSGLVVGSLIDGESEPFIVCVASFQPRYPFWNGAHERSPIHFLHTSYQSGNVQRT